MKAANVIAEALRGCGIEYPERVEVMSIMDALTANGYAIVEGGGLARTEPFAWICYHHDMCVRIEAIFAEEIDALRYAVGGGYLKVAPIGNGEIGNLP